MSGVPACSGFGLDGLTRVHDGVLGFGLVGLNLNNEIHIEEFRNASGVLC